MIDRDTESEIVIGMPIWFRVLAWLCLLVFVPLLIIGLVMILTGNGSMGYVITLIFIPLVLLGIWLVGMTTKLTFNKPKGFITVTSGYVPLFLWFMRKRIISRAEANGAFVTCLTTPTLIGQIGTLLLVLISLVPIYRGTSVSYEVKIVAASGKEVRLFKSRKAELAGYLAERIAGFSTQSEVIEDIINTQRIYQTEESTIYAGFGRRFAAFIIDFLIISTIMPVIGLTVDAIAGINMGQGAIIILPPVHFVYSIGFWIWRGQTPGKMIIGVKIVNTKGYSIGIGRSILRYLAYIVSAIIFYVGFFMIAWDNKSQGIHDMITSTYVIKTV